MNTFAFPYLVLLAAAVGAQDTFPLPASTTPGSTNALESTAPFVAPLRVSQSLVTDRTALFHQALPTTFRRWDMSGFDPSGRYVFTPCEVGNGAGVFRYDQQTGQMTVLMAGIPGAPRLANPSSWTAATDNFAALDSCTFTPAGTIITGEEATGGRLFEVQNPLSNGPFQIRWLTSIPAVKHEGLRFDRAGNLYFIDENASGCVHKFVPAVAGDYSAGQTFVLRVNAYGSHPNARPAEPWNSTANRTTTRFGAATWVPLTDAAGNHLTSTNPFVYVTANSGRLAADELTGTPYGRPEDMGFNVLANGNDCLYVAVTAENRVLAIELLTATTAMVRVFCDFDTINLATGVDVNPLQNDPYTSPGGGTVFHHPDNIAIDAWGSVYVIEDATPGDVWKCVDADKDGVAEAMGILLSLGVSGAEPTGMIFDPADPYRFIINVQHPTSGNDATWAFDTRPYGGSGVDLELRTGVSAGSNAGSNAGPGEFVKSAWPLDIVRITLDSPNATFVGRPFAVLLQPIATVAGTTEFLPSLWMTPYAPMFSLLGGAVGQFVSSLPATGNTTAIPVPGGLAGFSVIVQGFAFDASSMVVFTDAHEIVLR